MEQILESIARPIAGVLAWLYSLFPDYALIIVALTLVIMVVTTPLTLKSTRSMMLMQQLQPEIKKIQSQYKDDRQRLNEEQMKFFRENNLSPAGGCVPMLVQMPVFIVLYQVLRGLTRRVSDVGFNAGFHLGQLSTGATPSKAPDLRLAFDPAFLDHATALFTSLNGQLRMMSLGIDFSESASEALSQQGMVYSVPYLMLIAFVAGTAYVQQKQIQGRNPNAEINPQQQMLMKVMPFMLPVFSFALPAALVLYFVVSNLYRVGLQAYISRSIYGIKGAVPPKATGPSSEGSGPKKGGPPTSGPRKARDGSGREPRPGTTRPSNGTNRSGDDDAKGKSRVGAGRERAGAAAGVVRPGGKPAPKPEKQGSPTRSKSTQVSQKQPPGKADLAPGPALQPRARKPKKR